MKAKLCSRILPVIICSLISLPGCGIKSGKDLSVKDKKYLTGLGLLEANEQIILFNSQGTGLEPIRQSGNFFTDKRIASYWKYIEKTVPSLRYLWMRIVPIPGIFLTKR
jgi:hypothetical protein